MLKKFLSQLKKLLKQGTDRPTLQISLSFGLVFSLVPLPWASTLLISAIGLRLRWNVPLLLMLSYLLFPLQIVLLFPHINLGRWLVGEHPLPLETAWLETLIAQGSWALLEALGMNAAYALLGWLPVGLVVFLVSYLVLEKVLNYKF